jgi:hypothetical protein
MGAFCHSHCYVGIVINYIHVKLIYTYRLIIECVKIVVKYLSAYIDGINPQVMQILLTVTDRRVTCSDG